MRQTGVLLASRLCTMIDVMLNDLFQLSARCRAYVTAKFLWVRNAILRSVDIALITVCLNKAQCGVSCFRFLRPKRRVSARRQNHLSSRKRYTGLETTSF